MTRVVEHVPRSLAAKREGQRRASLARLTRIVSHAPKTTQPVKPRIAEERFDERREPSLEVADVEAALAGHLSDSRAEAVLERKAERDRQPRLRWPRRMPSDRAC